MTGPTTQPADPCPVCRVRPASDGGPCLICRSAPRPPPIVGAHFPKRGHGTSSSGRIYRPRPIVAKTIASIRANRRTIRDVFGVPDDFVEEFLDSIAARHDREAGR